MSFTRLYLVPVNGVQQVIDVDNQDLVLSGGTFVPVAVAPTITLVGTTFSSQYMPFGTASDLDLTQTPQTELRVCWREPVGQDDYPNENVIVAVDPTDGVCQCGITCNGTNISYAVVQNVTT
jgi:hypothetical protein